MKFNKNVHLITWILYGFSLALYNGFGVKYALFAEYAFMAAIIFQIVRWSLYIPDVKKKNYEEKSNM